SDAPHRPGSGREYRSWSIRGVLAQHQGAGALGEFELFQGTHAQQYLFAVKARRNDGTYVAQDDVTYAQAVEHRAITGGLTVGRLQQNRRTALKPQLAGDLSRNGDIGGAGIQQKHHRFAIDPPAGNEMPLDVAFQQHFDLPAADMRNGLLVGIEAALLPVGEKPCRQQDAYSPSQYQHDPAGTTTRRLAHYLALQPPGGVAKRQTIGRFSPSARVWALLSTPIQAPCSSSDSASALPNGVS